jgi:hypothetical protein
MSSRVAEIVARERGLSDGWRAEQLDAFERLARGYLVD